MSYGIELIIDIHNCKALPCDRKFLEKYFKELCKLIDMQPEDLNFWDYDGLPEEYENAPDHLKGITAVQFIRTSNITIHTLDALKKVFLNIFSCKDFSSEIVTDFSRNFFKGNIVTAKVVIRR